MTTETKTLAELKQMAFDAWKAVGTYETHIAALTSVREHTTEIVCRGSYSLAIKGLRKEQKAMRDLAEWYEERAERLASGHKQSEVTETQY